jgi:hypothetical protein
MAQETAEEQLARLRLKHGIEVLPETEVDPETGLTMSDRAKLAATGLLFNFADEAIAGIKALSPNVTYKDALAGEREQIKAAQAKDGSLKYEIGGALIPAVAGLIAAPFTGGTSAAATAPTWARLLGIGAAQGLAAGVGASEEEGLARLKDAPVSTVTGAIANPLFAKLSQAGQVALAPLFDKIKRSMTGKVGKKVEDEVLRMITDSGLTVDQFLMQVRDGQILPEMSEEAAKVVSGFALKAGPGSAIIRDEVVGRKNRFINSLYERFQTDLAPDSQGGNIFETFSDNIDDLKAAESAAYNTIYNASAGQTFQQLDQATLFLVRQSRNIRNIINKKLDDEGLAPLFKSTKVRGSNRGERTLELTRSLSLREGEFIKQALMDAKNKAKRSGSNNRAFTFGGYENEIKSVIDQISPELRDTRKSWAAIERAVEKYDEGQVIFGADPEKFAKEFRRLVDLGDIDAIEALRAGAGKALKIKSQSSSATGTVTKLADAPMGINQKEREILEILYPDGQVDDVINQINQARGSIVASNKTFGGSPTAERAGAASRVGIGQTVADVGRIVSSNGLDVGATANIVTRMFRGKKPPFTDDQFKKIAQLVISEDADLLEASLTDQTRTDALYGAFRKAINTLLGASQPRVQFATGATEGIGDIYDPVASGALEALVSTISPTAANAGTLPEIDLPSMYPQPNPFGLDAQGNYVGTDQSPALENLVKTVKPNVAQRIRQSAQ